MVDGDVWIFGDDINTDLIAPTPYIYLPAKEQARHVFEANRPGWVDKVKPGDFIVAGRNFGMGSSRPAPMVINALFFRNCVSFGLLALECPGVSRLLRERQRARVSFDNFTVRNLATGQTLKTVPVPPALISLMRSGGIFPLLEREGLIAPKPAGEAAQDAAQ